MPRRPKVSIEEAVDVLRPFIREKHFLRDDLPGPSANIWSELSKSFRGLWNARDCYREVHENRRNILGQARKLEGVTDVTTENIETSFNSTLGNKSQLDDDGDDDGDWEAPGLDSYHLPISAELWSELHEDKLIEYRDTKNYSVLRRGGWTDTLSEKFFALAQLPCAYIFKNAKVYESPDSVYHLTIRGKCKSEACGNLFRALIDRRPKQFPCVLRIRTRDTFYQMDQHEDVRRPVRHLKRMVIGEQAANDGASNWLKKQAGKYAETGARLPVHLPKLSVVRQCKSDFIQDKYDSKPEDKKNVVGAIENMRHNTKFPEYIHAVKQEKFYVSYSTPNQLHCYKRFFTVCKGKVSISIDGTGSIVQAILHPNGVKTGHIFLYCVVINFLGMSISVHQLLTECQNTNTLQYWLKDWLINLKAPKPQQVSVDCSRALMNAVSFALNDQSIKVYLMTLYFQASKDIRMVKSRPKIYSFVRLDVAHFIKKICRWRCVKEI